MRLKTTRKYEMGVRAKAAEITSEEIIRVVGELWMKYSIHEITLQMVAQNAGVTVMTILRKFGSKEGLFEAAIDHGFINYPYLSEYDPLLAKLKDEPQFQKLMERVKHEWENFEVVN